MSPTEKRNNQNRMQRVERIVNDSCRRMSSRAHRHTPWQPDRQQIDRVAIDHKIKDALQGAQTRNASQKEILAGRRSRENHRNAHATVIPKTEVERLATQSPKVYHQDSPDGPQSPESFL